MTSDADDLQALGGFLAGAGLTALLGGVGYSLMGYQWLATFFYALAVLAGIVRWLTSRFLEAETDGAGGDP